MPDVVMVKVRKGVKAWASLGKAFSFDFDRDIMPVIVAQWDRFGPDNMARAFRFHPRLLPVFSQESEYGRRWAQGTHRMIETDYGAFDLWPDEQMPRHTILFYGPAVLCTIRAREED